MFMKSHLSCLEEDRFVDLGG